MGSTDNPLTAAKPAFENLNLPAAPPRTYTEEQVAAKEERIHKSVLLKDVPPDKVPVIYSSKYNVTVAGLEKLHPFDGAKYRRVVENLVKWGCIEESQLVEPLEASESDLLVVHTPEYLKSLDWSWNVARILEVYAIAILPNWVVQRCLLTPFRLQTGGSVLAAKLAVDQGWAINIGGGFHHACAYLGTKGGYCIYADVTLLIDFARSQLGVQRVLILDFDAHQGNGYQRDFIGDDDAYIIDAYNAEVDPWDVPARPAIRRPIELKCGTTTEEYLKLVKDNLEAAEKEFLPDLIVFCAGTDILDGDPLGLLKVSEQGLLERDEIVFRFAAKLKVPIVMLTSGGYQRVTGLVIAKSIANLADKGLIDLKPRKSIMGAQ